MNVTLAPEAVLTAATWRDYLALTKPRVISLLLFTALAAMFIASDHAHPVTLLKFIAVALGGFAAAGAANAINMAYDRDIDGRMDRTANRPTVTNQIPLLNALLFAFALETFSFVLLYELANLLAAEMALCGLAFYVLIYTMLLKRRTLHNIVIGGAAGAFPPLVGWAAVSNHLDAMAWMLFAIVFVWTPVHFWALALLLKDEYARVGIPMLPVVKGDRVTVVKIVAYALVTFAVSVAPFFMRRLGVLYLVSAIILSGALIWKSLQLYNKVERKQASGLFHYSMIYLAALFLMMAVDRML